VGLLGATPRRRRIVIAVAVVLAALAAVPFAVRAHGRSLLAEVRARHAAAGLGTSARDLAALLPPVDADLQRRCDAQERAMNDPMIQERVQEAMSRSGDEEREQVDAWIVGACDAPPDSLDAGLERLRPIMEPYAAILREDGLLLGTAARLSSVPASTTVRFRDVLPLMLSKINVWTEATRWLRSSALRGPDAGPFLDSLDGQYRALLHPASQVDAIMANLFAAERDRTYVELGLLGRLPPDRAVRWLVEEPEHLRRCADGLRASRLLFLSAVADGLADGSVGAGDLGPGAPSWGSPGDWLARAQLGPDLWLRGMEYLAQLLDLHVDAEARLRGLPATLDPETIRSWTTGAPKGSVVSSALSGFEAYGRSGIGGRTLRRMARLVVRTLACRAERGRLPADDAELRSWLGEAASALDPGPLDLPIRYESPAPGVLRLAPDPKGPLPALQGGRRELEEATLLGRPVATGSIVWESEGIEVHLAK